MDWKEGILKLATQKNITAPKSSAREAINMNKVLNLAIKYHNIKKRAFVVEFYKIYERERENRGTFN